MNSVKRKTGLSGPVGLVCSIISQATNDAIGAHSQRDMLDAWAYLGGPNYRRQVELLGFHPDIRPDPISKLTVDDYDRLVKRIDDGK